MSTLAEFMIVAGADSRPPMLDKPQYESWKSHMELYIQEDDTIRLKTYEVLSDKEKLQVDCDLKATDIVLQGTSLSRQERECKLYDKFDKLSHVKGETLYQYYLCLPLDWAKFINDVKLARDLHTSNYDQLYAYLQQHEAHTNEARLMRERFPGLLALVSNYHPQSSHFNNYHSQYTTP
ncbi:hypothetical protein Tco_1010049 [Tanacetum coccineum]